MNKEINYRELFEISMRNWMIKSPNPTDAFNCMRAASSLEIDIREIRLSYFELRVLLISASVVISHMLDGVFPKNIDPIDLNEIEKIVDYMVRFESMFGENFKIVFTDLLKLKIKEERGKWGR